MKTQGIPPVVWKSFYTTWAWAVGQLGYDKQKFLDMERHLLELARIKKGLIQI